MNELAQAVHEAGHAVVAAHLGCEVTFVSVDAEHEVVTRWTGGSGSYQEHGLIGLAGHVAERLRGFEACGSDRDIHEAWQDHRALRKKLRDKGDRFSVPDSVGFLVDDAVSVTMLLARPDIAPHVDRLAALLLEHGTLSGAALHAALADVPRADGRFLTCAT
jgi:hypothetical protein